MDSQPFVQDVFEAIKNLRKQLEYERAAKDKALAAAAGVAKREPVELLKRIAELQDEVERLHAERKIVTVSFSIDRADVVAQFVARFSNVLSHNLVDYKLVPGPGATFKLHVQLEQKASASRN